MTLSNIDIPKIIPHDDSFRFVDRIISEDIEECSLTALVSFSQHSDIFKGHYSQEQIVPGIIVIEALSQCSILCGCRFLSSSSEVKLMHLTIEVQSKFKKTIHYTDDILLYSKVEKNIGGISVFKVKAINAKSNEVCVIGRIMGVALAHSLIESKDEEAENHK